MNNDIAKDAAELLPCPFCGAESQQHDGDHAVNHSDKCFLTHHYAQETWLLGKRKVKLWNTRATAADKERIAYVVQQLHELDCGAAPVEELARRAVRHMDDLERKLAAKTQECEGLRELLKRVLKIVPDEAMFERGEDPHPPSVLWVDIDAVLSDSARKERE